MRGKDPLLGALAVFMALSTAGIPLYVNAAGSLQMMYWPTEMLTDTDMLEIPVGIINSPDVETNYRLLLTTESLPFVLNETAGVLLPGEAALIRLHVVLSVEPGQPQDIQLTIELFDSYGLEQSEGLLVHYEPESGNQEVPHVILHDNNAEDDSLWEIAIGWGMISSVLAIVVALAATSQTFTRGIERAYEIVLNLF